jgi:hypothetical protein
MADKTWKVFERVASTFFGTTRTPLSGGNGKQTRSDSLHPRLFISCKYSKASSLHSLFAEEQTKANVEGKIPIICTKKKGTDGFLITIHSKDFESVCKLHDAESISRSVQGKEDSTTEETG